MTNQRDKAIVEPSVGVDETSARLAAAPMSRRAMIRGASIAAPAIVTLSTASVQAAMASALVVTPHNGAVDGKFHCLDETTTAGFAPSPPYPAGSLELDSVRTPMVYRYPDRNHVMPKPDGSCGGSTAPVTELEMCQGTTASTGAANSTYCYQGQGWNTVRVPRGMMMSASAMASAGITLNNIRDV